MLQRFADISSLSFNEEKSQIAIAGVPKDVRASVLKIIGFE